MTFPNRADPSFHSVHSLLALTTHVPGLILFSIVSANNPCRRFESSSSGRMDEVTTESTRNSTKTSSGLSVPTSTTARRAGPHAAATAAAGAGGTGGRAGSCRGDRGDTGWRGWLRGRSGGRVGVSRRNWIPPSKQFPVRLDWGRRDCNGRADLGRRGHGRPRWSVDSAFLYVPLAPFTLQVKEEKGRAGDRLMYIRGFLKGFLVLLNHIEREILSFVVS